MSKYEQEFHRVTIEMEGGTLTEHRPYLPLHTSSSIFESSAVTNIVDAEVSSSES